MRADQLKLACTAYLPIFQGYEIALQIVSNFFKNTRKKRNKTFKASFVCRRAAMVVTAVFKNVATFLARKLRKRVSVVVIV